MKDFHSKASFEYMDKKQIEAMIVFSAPSIDIINIDAGITTPPEVFGKTKLTYGHRFTMDYKDVTVTGQLNMDAAEFGDFNFELKKSGSLKDLQIMGKAIHKGEAIAVG